MKKVAKGLIAASLLTTVIPTNFEAQAVEEQPKTEQLIIMFKEDGSLSRDEKEDLNIDTTSASEGMELIEVSVKDTENVIEQLEATEDVEYVVENTVYQLAADETISGKVASASAVTGPDTYVEQQWNLDLMKAKEFWAKVPKDNQVIVAVLDTGVSSTHEDLEYRVLKNQGRTFLASTGEAGLAGGEDDQGHGTFVAGIVAAEANNAKGIAGVAGDANVKILPVKVMNKSGVGTAFSIAQGIRYSADQGADVINLSISGEYNEAVEQAVDYANGKGAVVVAASGNGGGNADASFPAALDNVISVGSVAEKDQAFAGSNEGTTVDLVAPGVNIVSTSLNGDLGTSETSRYTTGTGTSYATAHVAAVAAMYKAKHTTANPAEIEKALVKTAIDLGKVGHDNKTGYGRVDAVAALADDIDVEKSTFTAPRKNAEVMGDIPIEVALIKSGYSSVEFKIGTESVGVVSVVDNKAVMNIDTTKFADGKYEITAIATGVGVVQSEIKTSITIRNQATSGYMFNVLAPNKSIAKGATVQLFEKVDGAYKEIWTGVSDANGTARVPSHVGTDLKDLKVVVQGKFIPEDSTTEAAFMYSKDVSSKGTLKLESENTVALNLATKDGWNDVAAQYFVALKDEAGLTVNEMKLINSADGSENANLYVDKGMYNLFSYAKTDEKVYFLSKTNQQIDHAQNIIFDAAESGEVKLDNENQALENAILYLYNDDMNEALGSDVIATSKKFYVTPGEYHYLVDAEMKATGTEKNWLYILANDKKKAVVTKGNSTAIKAGGEITLSRFEGDQESIKRFAKQRGVNYKERSDQMDAYKSDLAFYTVQTFSDQYENQLVGMSRGTLNGKDGALYKKNVLSGETTSTTTEDEWQVEAKDFGDIYAEYEVKRHEGNKVLLNSQQKNATNPANRMYYMYSFLILSDIDYKKGTYDISLRMAENPLMPKGIDEKIVMNLMDSGTTMELKVDGGAYVNAYITLARAEKDEHGDIEWTSYLTKNAEKTNQLAIPDNLQSSSLKNGNVAIIRYKVGGALGKNAYIFKQFDKIEDLAQPISIPTNLKEVTVSEVEGSKKLDGIGTKLLMIKKPITIDGETTYATVNNLQNYKHNSIFLEASEEEYMIEGNYVSLPKGADGKDNYYFLEPYKVEANKDNTVIFDKEKLAKIDINANTSGFSDVRGAIVYPYNKYSDTFVKTLRTGNHFYVPTDLEMDLQVQLGFGDPESKDVLWNYFMTKGKQIFKTGDEITWDLGGTLKTKVDLTTKEVQQGAELAGSLAIEDAYNNQLSSVIVNTTNDYTTAGEGALEEAYKLSKDGQIKAIANNVEGYTISHSVPAADAKSVKPVISILDDSNQLVKKASSLNYYSHLHGITAPTTNGTYKLLLQIAGSPLGVSSSDVTFNVKSSGEANTETPEVPTITDNLTSVSGIAQPHAVVTLEVNGRVIATAIANEKGEYMLKFKKHTAGTVLNLVTTIDGNRTTTSILIGDATPPKVAAIGVVSNNGNKISIKAEPYATVKLTIAGKTYTVKANAKGVAVFNVKAPKAGTKWTATATDAAKNTTKISGIVLDKKAPKIISIKAANNSSKFVVKTEKGAIITLVIGNKVYKKVANKAGSYSFDIKKLPAGTKWSIKVTDKAGNTSTKTGTVLDKTAPKKVVLAKKVTPSTSVISGKAEANATITIYRNGKKFKSVRASSKGIFNVSIGKQSKLTKFTFVVKDRAGNVSKNSTTVVK